PRAWPLEAFGIAWGNQTAEAEQGAQVRFSVTEAGFDVCPLSLGGGARPSLSVCAGWEVAFFASEAQGFAAPKSSLDPAVRVFSASRLSLPIARGFAARVGGEVGLAVLRDQFVYKDASKAVHVISGSPLLAAECDAGVAAAFP